MSVSAPERVAALPDDAAIEAFIEGVRVVTGGRIRDFSVARVDERLELRGEADSFYVRQLVLCLAAELPGEPHVTDRISVPTRPR